MKRFFVTGIGTDVGKTIASAILVESLHADYWKPIQAGDLDNTDTMKVRSLISNTTSKFHPETYQLTKPVSPHAAAEADGIKINIDTLTLPITTNSLIIEGAGGLMVPLNDKFLVIDLIQKLKAEVILVSSNYLGSINHTLLTVEALKSRNIPIAGIIFNGRSAKTSEEYILSYTGLKRLLSIEEEKKIDKEMVLKYEAMLKPAFVNQK
ncbi:MAG: dethiobiotin synthase [Bacteroidia bacterium]|nr:dethiobiotin synthase [Bacteroidia bacterium]